MMLSTTTSSCPEFRAAERIGNLFHVYGNSDYIGEAVSILEHSWQSFECAAKQQEHVDVQMACLLHDIGHMLGMEAGFPIGMNGCGIAHHEAIGGDFLRSLGFPERVAWLVANHVNAKRFLVWEDPNYQLSSASQTTLTFQGGPMTDDEAQNFMAAKGYDAVLDMRKYDEAAKVPGRPVPSTSHIKSAIRKYLEKVPKTGVADLSAYRLSSEQKRFFQEQGYLVIKGEGFTDATQLSEMADALSAVAEGNDVPPNLLIHHEQVLTPGGPKVQLCRVENFVKHEKRWSDVEAFVRGICGELFDEPAVLFKDKLNFKLPGGRGFLAHQDVTAYKSSEFAKLHISVMVAIDAALSSQVGPLQMAGGRHEEILPNSKGVIDLSVETSLDFDELLVDAGDLVFFNSYVPHRSGTNLSDKPRRLAYLTYNKLSEGDFNEVYYAAKLDVFANGTGGPISINDDFAGTIVAR